MFKLLNEDSKARAGILTINGRKAKTPFLMPCATKASVKFITPQDLKEIGTEAVICNSLVLSLNPGIKIIKKHDDLHGFMGYKGIIFTDSGGFQQDRESFYMKSQHDGIVFRNPWHGKQFLYTPKDAMKTQELLGSDVAMVLDDMAPVHAAKEQVHLAMARTHGWAEQCLLHHSRKKQLLFGIAQGGLFKDLREKSAAFISSLGFDGVAIGGLALGEGHEKMVDMVKCSINHLDEKKPRYLMGVGNPADIVEAVALGVDCFDSAYHTQNARHGTLFTWQGRLKILNARYKQDKSPLDKDCGCYVCQNFTRAYLSYQMRMKEPTGLRLCSYHNLYFMQTLMEKIRESIKEGAFEKLRKDIKRKFQQKA